MKVKLLKDARIWHKSGEILEVSPEECHFLVSTNGAVVVDAVKASVAAEVPEKKVEKAETPEKRIVKAETPEKKAPVPRTAAKKPVTKKK